MGELDRANLLRRATDNNNRMDQQAQVIETYSKTLADHEQRLRAISATASETSVCANDLLFQIDAEREKIKNLELKVAALELRRVMDGGTFWRRLRWLFSGDSRISTLR